MWLRMIPTGLDISTRTTFGDQTDTAHTVYSTVCTENLNPDVVMVKPAEDRV
jgi:hypothetical protein